MTNEEKEKLLLSLLKWIAELKQNNIVWCELTKKVKETQIEIIESDNLSPKEKKAKKDKLEDSLNKAHYLLYHLGHRNWLKVAIRPTDYLTGEPVCFPKENASTITEEGLLALKSENLSLPSAKDWKSLITEV